LAVSGSLALEFIDERGASESTAKRSSHAGRSHGDVVVVAPETDLVARLDPERVTQLLRDHDLALGADTMLSHTMQYNCGLWQSPAP